MYQRLEWKDHVVEFPNRFKEVNLGNGLVEETPAPGEIIQQGTPQSARNFNNIEEGILAGTEMGDYLADQHADLPVQQQRQDGRAGNAA